MVSSFLLLSEEGALSGMLAPPGLINLAEKIDGSSVDVQDIHELESVTTIRFEGGGSILSFGVSKETEHTMVNAGDVETLTYSGIEGGRVTKELTLKGFGLTVGATGGHARAEDQFSDRVRTTNGDDDGFMGFSLGDPDAGDYFVVSVYLDPVYKTFVFAVQGGASMCPHETGTERIEKPKISVLNRRVRQKSRL
jgi:hypothetical protein